jgi:hypothetical protein
MIQAYAHQKGLREARLNIKTLERLFAKVSENLGYRGHEPYC